MNRKLFVIALALIFLMTSLGFAFAQSDSHSIDVKVIWDDNGAGDRPDFVKVNLIKDGNVVDTQTVTAADSWKTSFNVNDDGNYDIKQEDIDNYSTKVTQNGDDFKIVNKIVKSDVSDDSDALGAAAQDNNAGGDILSNNNQSAVNATNNNTQNNATNSTDDNSTDDNETEVNATDENETDDMAIAGGSDDGNASAPTTLNSPSKDKSPVKEEPKKKVVKKYKTVTKTKTTPHKTGLPIVGLVLFAMIAAFVPFTRKKD